MIWCKEALPDFSRPTAVTDCLETSTLWEVLTLSVVSCEIQPALYACASFLLPPPLFNLIEKW